MHVDDVAGMKEVFRIPLLGPGKIVRTENQLLLPDARSHLVGKNIRHQGVLVIPGSVGWRQSG